MAALRYYRNTVLHCPSTLSLGLSVLLAWSTVAARQTREDGTPAVQLLAFNDFHGHLDPPTGSNGRIGSTEAGGVEYLATHLRRLESQNPNTLIVAAGDLIGASPLLSGLFHDEPTIEALNAVGLDLASVGNHEFDDGWAELYRMQHGGCHPVDGCQDGTPYEGATFQYLSANVTLDPRSADKAALSTSGIDAGRPRTLFPAYVVKEVGGVKVGFIGLTLRGTSEIVQASGIKGLTFRAEAETVNRLIPSLKKEGAHAIVVLVHEGGRPGAADYNGCDGVSGAIARIAGQISDEVDVIVSGHTHMAYVCTFDEKLVTSAASYGRLITAIDLKIDRSGKRVLSKTARNILVTRDVEKSPVHTMLLDRYRPFHAVVADRIVGTITGAITRSPSPAGESPLGNAVADAILEATRPQAAGAATIALMNPGGIRADLTAEPGSSGASPVRYGEVFNALPFQNRLVVKTLTGEMIRRVLEQQFENRTSGPDAILQVSTGVTYAYDRSKPEGRRIDAASMMSAGQPIRARQTYRVGLTDFLADGGDNFSVFTRGTDPVYSISDADALAAYIGRHSPLAPPPAQRITRIK